MNIVILDACRNNDLPRSLRNVRSGLARMDAPVGTFIAFSTAPGRVALDGDGRNSPFTQSLLASIREPDRRLLLQVTDSAMNIGSFRTHPGTFTG